MTMAMTAQVGFDPVADLWRRYVEWSALQSASSVAREQKLLRDMIARATPPEACGPEIIAAPARGTMRLFREEVLVPKASVAEPKRPEDYERRSLNWLGRDAVRRADVWDEMERQALRAARGAPIEAPFTHAQVSMGRFYRDLTERHAAGGVRCSSLEAQARASGGKGGEFIDAYVQEGRVLDALHRRIGGGTAMAVRRVRPSTRSMRARPGATIITSRVLVDSVCLGEKPLSWVLKQHGWSVASKNLEVLRAALRAALDRMQGYRDDA
ncbi:hypothetical protein [Frigidibacter sp. MR17.24]|uniref:hypothetical protein n=1 Tax=Frigidibacter sp. MR17.24 TaxID=3127345 RepID=UPI003012AB56